jgi:hypothetical protein
VQALKKLRDVRDVLQLAPAGLEKLPAPVKPYGQQEGRLQALCRANKPAKTFFEKTKFAAACGFTICHIFIS